MYINKDKIIEEVEDMYVMEVVEMIYEMEEKLGV